MSGYIYCFSNERMNGIYKIGFTTRDIPLRLGEMNRQCTHRLCDDIYKNEFAKKVNECRKTEGIIHSVLETLGARLYPNREFFKISLSFIKNLFNLYEGEWYDNDIVNINNSMILTTPVEEKIKIIKRDEISNLDDDGITCNVCLKSYKTRTTYNRHVCKAIDDSITCNFCNKEFKTKYNRKNHEIRCASVTSI